MRVPTEFAHPLFFPDGQMLDKLPDEPFPRLMKHVPFYYDIVRVSPLPWEEIERSLPALVALWREEKEELERCFARRDRRAARGPIVRGVAYLLSALCWLNGRPAANVVRWEEMVAALPYKPANAVERLQFIFHRPDVYPAFVQLRELFIETEKLACKQMAMKKRMTQ
ncbi:YpoC family protein [Geobacillus subterraneus]|uniref:YpoC family protein n=1 Tax=Geobacillus subterraneus TaxID=129338 RepID=UPI00160B15F0